jgi:heme exporter protein D
LGSRVSFTGGSRLAPASRGYIRALQPALAWLAVTGLGLTASAVYALVEGVPVRFSDIDALRHIFALGVVTLLIVAMSQLILPEFASERLVARPWRHRGLAFGVALTVAAVHRGVLPWAGLEGDARYREMAVGGAIGLASVAAFAFLYVRALRRHRAYLARIALLRAREVSVRTLDQASAGEIPGNTR